VKDSDKDHITIGWDPPKRDGGAPIKGYNVERKDPRTGKWTKINKSPIKVQHCSNFFYHLRLSFIFFSPMMVVNRLTDY
jgi:hypothetical protein